MGVARGRDGGSGGVLEVGCSVMSEMKERPAWAKGVDEGEEEEEEAARMSSRVRENFSPGMDIM